MEKQYVALKAKQGTGMSCVILQIIKTNVLSIYCKLMFLKFYKSPQPYKAQ